VRGREPPQRATRPGTRTLVDDASASVAGDAPQGAVVSQLGGDEPVE